MSATNHLHTWPSLPEAEMMKISSQIAQALKLADVVALSGDLGAGKTTLARGIIQSLSSAPVDVTSPTFTLMQDYPVILASGKQANLLHCDLYRLGSASEVHTIGLLEMLDNHITIIEWPQIVLPLLPKETLLVECAMGDDKNTRRLSLHGVGEWKLRLNFQP